MQGYQQDLIMNHALSRNIVRNFVRNDYKTLIVFINIFIFLLERFVILFFFPKAFKLFIKLVFWFLYYEVVIVI